MKSPGVSGETLLEELLATKKIDWNGYADRHPSAVTWAGDPVPVLKKSGPVYPLALAEAQKLERSMKPISSDKFATLIYKLQGHYWQPGMPESLMREVAKDYIRLLGHHHLDVFAAVVDDMLLDPAIKFFPKIAQLNEAMEIKMSAKKFRLMKLQKLLDKAE